MNEIIINSNENYLHIHNNIKNNPTSTTHIIECEESVDIMKAWYEENEDNTNTHGKYNVVNVFSGKSNAATKAEVNQIIKKLCTNELEIICSLEFDDYLSLDNAHSIYEGSIQR